MCTLARIITTSLDASDVIPQPPPITALSRHVSGISQFGDCGLGKPNWIRRYMTMETWGNIICLSEELKPVCIVILNGRLLRAAAAAK